MDETMTGTESAVESVAEASDIWDAAFDEDWDSPEGETSQEDGASDENADEQKSETTEEKPDGSEEKEADPPATEDKQGEQEKLYSLKHLGQSKEVGLSELMTLGQKGLDYDRVKSELASLKAGKEEAANEHEAFLKELADADGVDVEELIDNIRAAAIAKKDNIQHDRALEKVKYERKIRELERKATQAKSPTADAQEARRADFLKFHEAHPDVTNEQVQALPNEVWERVAEGMSLNESYTIYEMKALRDENKRLKEEAAAREQEAKNKARSTGSRKSSGANQTKDAWDRYWDSGD